MTTGTGSGIQTVQTVQTIQTVNCGRTQRILPIIDGEGDHEVVEGIFTPRTALSPGSRTPPPRRKMRRATSPLLRNREETLQTLQTVFPRPATDAPPLATRVITSLLIAP